MIVHHLLALGLLSQVLLGHVHGDQKFKQNSDVDAVSESLGGSSSAKSTEKTADGKNTQDPTEKDPEQHFTICPLHSFSRTSGASRCILRLVAKQIRPEEMSGRSSIVHSFSSSGSHSFKSRHDLIISRWRITGFLVIHCILVLLSLILFSQLPNSSNGAQIISLGLYFLVGAPLNECPVLTHTLSLLTRKMGTLHIQPYLIQDFLSQIYLRRWLLLHVWTRIVILLSGDDSMNVLILLKIIRRYKCVVGKHFTREHQSYKRSFFFDLFSEPTQLELGDSHRRKFTTFDFALSFGSRDKLEFNGQVPVCGFADGDILLGRRSSIHPISLPSSLNMSLENAITRSLGRRRIINRLRQILIGPIGCSKLGVITLIHLRIINYK